jgi:beta-galactosidase
VAFAGIAQAARMTETINRDWTFRYFPQPEPDRGRLAVGYDDHACRPVALPHTWSTYETTRQVHPFIQAANEHEGDYWWRGWGWYHKRLIIGEECAGRLVSLEFDGVQKYARVYVNGHLAGEHKGGSTSFSVDITRQVKFGQENLIAVEVSNQRDDSFGGIPPMTAGNFNVYGGMYRDVRLVIQDRLHFPFQGSADYEGGTFVTTPHVSTGRGAVRVETWVRNDYAQVRSCELVTTIIDTGGNNVARIATKREIAAGETSRFDQQTDVTQPHLWSPDTPYMYRVHSEIRAADAVADEMTSPLGFRWFRWDKAEHKLYLNGQPIVLNGTNRHEEYPWLGAAIPKWMEKKDLEDMRWNLGHNFQRTVHYPNDPYVYDLSDQLGIMTTEEVPNIKDRMFGRDIQRRNVREMIRRDRNHPCIFFWSMGNETNRPADSAWAKEEAPHASSICGARRTAVRTSRRQSMTWRSKLCCAARFVDGMTATARFPKEVIRPTGRERGPKNGSTTRPGPTSSAARDKTLSCSCTPTTALTASTAIARCSMSTRRAG